jgi:hypothetical protein
MAGGDSSFSVGLYRKRLKVRGPMGVGRWIADEYIGI